MGINVLSDLVVDKMSSVAHPSLSWPAHQLMHWSLIIGKISQLRTSLHLEDEYSKNSGNVYDSEVPFEGDDPSSEAAAA